MKLYIVLDHEFRLVGSLADKTDAALFKRQRKVNNFNIIEMSKKEFISKFGSLSILTERQAFLSHGYLIFPDEELFLYEDFEYKYTNFSATLIHFVQDIMPYLKLKDDEDETVNKFLGTLHSILKESNVMMHDEDEVYDHDNHFKMDKLTREVVNSFGGRK